MMSSALVLFALALVFVPAATMATNDLQHQNTIQPLSRSMAPVQQQQAPNIPLIIGIVVVVVIFVIFIIFLIYYYVRRRMLRRMEYQSV